MVRSDINQTMVHMQKAIAVDVSCVQAYDTIASIELQRYILHVYIRVYIQTVQTRVCVHYSCLIDVLIKQQLRSWVQDRRR